MSPALISAPALRARMASGAPCLLIDCSFDLVDPQAGERKHAQRHLPDALYLHLDSDLSAPKTDAADASRGRHPLPDRAAFARKLAGLGLHDELPVVAYDDSGGMYAARLWWMLRWVGHGAVQVLDGGLAAWGKAGGQLPGGAVAALAPALFTLRPPLVSAVDYSALRAGLGPAGRLIIDARSPDRFRGENETLDPVGGHIPGALNRFFRDNLAADACFKPAAQLRAEWAAVTGGRPAAELVMQCGSGVTACHNLLALELAGLPGAQLYPGSWSEWCAQPGAPVAVGA